MEILSFRTIWGPNVYHYKPVMIMKVNLGEWTEVSSADVPEFKSKLLSLLPELQEHECSPGRPGGFCERLDRGTYMAHVTEHVALELSQKAGIGVTFGKARHAGRDGHYHIITRFENESGMKVCLEEAFCMVKSLLLQMPFDVEKCVEHIQEAARKTALGPSGQALLSEARRRNIPTRRLFDNSLVQLGYGKHRRFIQAAVTDQTNLIATEILQDKSQTKSLLNRYSIPTPQGVLADNVSEIENQIQSLKFPLVVKPFDGHHGLGVELNLRSVDELKDAFVRTQKYSQTVLIEEMCEGRDYRVLVVNGKLVAAAERRPPSVFGDGISSIRMLIEALNSDPRRGNGHENFLTKIETDDVLIEYLAKQSLTLETVIEKNREVTLRGNANLSSGGTAHDVTSSVHPEVRSLCERTARLLNIDICGIDLIHKDLSLPVSQGLVVIEVNAGPGLRMHLQPTAGTVQPVAEKIIEMLYPPHASSRIPIVSVTGTNGKTTVSRMMRKILSTPLNCVGLTTTDGIWIGEDRIVKGDTTGPLSTELVLSDPSVDLAVLEVARGGILRGGLAYDYSDVSVITNIKPDHLGQDGIETVEDLIWIKSLVAERVREGGWLVLNADDPASLNLKENSNVNRTPKNYFLFSTNPMNPALMKHLHEGHAGCWYEDGALYIQKDGILTRLLDASEIPATLEGKARFQIANALAAAAGSFCMGASIHEIRAGLQSFRTAFENSGRMNFYRVGKGHILLDYAHNPEAIQALGEMVRNLGPYHATLVASLPGDRTDDLLRQSAQIMAKSFDRVIVKEEKDLRGRKPQEVTNLILDVISKEAPQLPKQFVASETEALQQALENVSENDLIVFLQDDLDPLLATLRQFDPVPVDAPPVKSSLEGKVLQLPLKWQEQVHHA